MSFIESIGDDLLYGFSFIIFIGVVSLAWLSSYVSDIHIPTTLFIIERRTHLRNEQPERTVVTPSSNSNEQVRTPSSVHETSTERESDIESSEVEEPLSEQALATTESNTSQTEQTQLNTDINPHESACQTATASIDKQHQQQVEEEEEEEGKDQSLRITIKFLNETQKSIIANPNDTISKIKRSYFADELTSNKIVRFIYQGRELKDTETLRTCNIRDQTIIHCQISARRHSIPNRTNDDISATPINTNGFDASPIFDTAPLSISPCFVFLLALMLGSSWYLRIKYRVLFTPISTIVLLLFTIMLIIFTCGLLLTRRRQLSNAGIPIRLRHVHID